MTPQDKLNYQRKATYDQHVQSKDFPFMDGSQDCEDSYTLGFVTACMWLTEQYIKDLADLRKELCEARELITQN